MIFWSDADFQNLDSGPILGGRPVWEADLSGRLTWITQVVDLPGNVGDLFLNFNLYTYIYMGQGPYSENRN